MDNLNDTERLQPIQIQCIHDLLKAQGTREPHQIAVMAPERAPLTYGRLWRHIEATVHTLNALGVGRNDRVAMVLPNGPEMAVAFLAVAAGATSAPLNPAYRTSEVDLYLSDLKAKALMVQAGIDAPAIAFAQTHGIPIIELSPVLESEAGIFKLTSEEPSATARGGFAQPDDIALMLHTSGTTSRPKIVPLTQTNICTSANHIRTTLALDAQDRCLNVMPLFHIHGLIGATLSSLVAGASLVCTPGFEASKFFDWLDAFQPTWYTAVPTMHQAVLAGAAAHRAPISRYPLRLIRSCSAALPPQVMAEMEKVFGAPVIDSYGMTEAAHQMASNPLPPRRRKPGSVGMAAGPDIAIMDEAGHILPSGQIGEIVVRGANVTSGYENNPAANAQAFTNGWFRTGDQGRMDPDGYLFITGRLKEIINRGGETIAPGEVDAALLAHPAVAQAVAFAVPHVTLGEEVAAAVVLKEPASSTERELREFVSDKLADYKVPSRILMVQDIPKGPTGKLQRLGLADQLASELQAAFVAPRNALEAELACIWAETLEVEQVGVEDNFFALGGDSLLAARLLAQIEQRLGKRLPAGTLFQTSTVGQLGSCLQDIESVSSLPAPDVTPSDASRPIQEPFWRGLKNRVLQLIALYAPGAMTLRVWLHRLRGVKIGHHTFIGTATILETAHPELIAIGDNVSLSIRSVIIAHFKETAESARRHHEPTVRIENDVYIGPGVILLPHVTIGQGAVVTAGSVVNKSVPPQTMVQGNPAVPVARCVIPLARRYSYDHFLRHLQPMDQ